MRAGKETVPVPVKINLVVPLILPVARSDAVNVCVLILVPLTIAALFATVAKLVVPTLMVNAPEIVKVAELTWLINSVLQFRFVPIVRVNVALAMLIVSHNRLPVLKVPAAPINNVDPVVVIVPAM